ncbi:ABC transporter substrate-binding protein [Rhodococcus sp. HM1]|nr:ABC transporter substrate-binding protein [Rhodococcus sp. HM1]
MQPDLVLGSWLVDPETDFDTLSAVAPTVAPLGDTGVDRWDEQVRVLGEILGRSDDAEKIISDREAEIAEAALPGLAGRTGVLSQYVVGQGQFAVVDYPTVAAFNTPSSLSIGYALDTIRPQLEAIAGV